MRPAFTIYALHGTPTGFECDDSHAVMRIRQALFPKPAGVDWKSDRMGYFEIVGPLEFSDYVAIRQTVDAIRENDRIEQVLCYTNCPGGVAAGAPETAAAINELNKVKPILCVGEGYVTSAGYMLAAQCAELVVSPTCMIGSVGTRTVLIDDSELFKKLGIRVIPISTGADKNVGLEGVPVDDEAVATMLDMVNAYQRQFILTLAKSPFLNADKVLALAERASLWLGDSAVQKGFATRLGTFEQITAELRQTNKNRDAAIAKQAIESLTGDDALERFEAMIAAAAGCELYDVDDAPASIRKQISAEYPGLAKAAVRYQAEVDALPAKRR